MLYFKLYPFTLLKHSRSFTFLFIYLGEQLQYYQSSNNVPQSANTLDFDLKSCFVLLNHWSLKKDWIEQPICLDWGCLLNFEYSVFGYFAPFSNSNHVSEYSLPTENWRIFEIRIQPNSANIRYRPNSGEYSKFESNRIVRIFATYRIVANIRNSNPTE